MGTSTLRFPLLFGCIGFALMAVAKLLGGSELLKNTENGNTMCNLGYGDPLTYENFMGYDFSFSPKQANRFCQFNQFSYLCRRKVRSSSSMDRTTLS